MADKVLCDKSDLVNIADAVRSKLGVTDTYYVSELSSAIQSIQTGGITPSGTISITENGTVDVSQYANAEVNVSATPSLQSKSVTYTANGTATITPDAGYDGLSSVDVTVNVSGLGDINGGNGNYGIDSPQFHLSNCKMRDFGFRELDSSFTLIGNVTLENVVFIGGSVTISNLNLDNVELRNVSFIRCSVTCSQTFYDAFLAGDNYSEDTNFDIV